MSALATASFTLRPVEEADRDFLFRLYASTRDEELSVTGWSEEQKRAFLLQQFEAQTADWAANYPGADRRLIEVDGAPAGRFYVLRAAAEICLIDIALLPEYRRLGIGGELLRRLLEEARERGLPVTLHVEVFNPARSLYARHGFRVVEDRGVYLFLRWRPGDAEGRVS
jgi:ribosomal protein S18 acetylase RimI-like enzyme